MLGSNLDDMQRTLCQDYEHSPEHRFRHPGSKNFQNVSKPSPVLHMSNLNQDVTLEKVQDLIDNFQALNDIEIQNHRVFSTSATDGSSKSMMLMGLANLEQAVRVLAVLHNQEIDEKKIKISFAKSTTINPKQ